MAVLLSLSVTALIRCAGKATNRGGERGQMVRAEDGGKIRSML